MKQPDLVELERPELKENLVTRAILLVQAETDIQMQVAILKMCRYGTPDGMPGYLYWFTFFACVYEPRNPPGKQKLPFMPYEFQKEELAVLHKAIIEGQGVLGEPSNIVWIKSRDMGVTWIILMYFFWDWLFNNGSYLVGHMKADKVDKLGDMGTHFEKLRWQLRQQPVWMYPQDWNWRTCSKEFLLKNPRGGEITGDTANPEFGRGDRRKAILYDELPVWDYDVSCWKAGAGTTNVRLGVGTPKNKHGKFSRLVHGKDPEEVQVRRVHWRQHPLKGQGATLVNNKWTSPWYEREKRRLNPDEVASELDLDFNESRRAVIFTGYGIGHKRDNLSYLSEFPMITVWDPGRVFYVLFLQANHHGQFRALKEICISQARIRDVAELVGNTSEKMFPGLAFEDCGDPSGSWIGNSGQDDPEYVILEKEFERHVEWGYMADIPAVKRTRLKIKAIEDKLSRYIGTGDDANDGPALLINTKECPILDEALSGAYHWKVDPRTNEVLDIVDERHPYEDAIDCLAMGILYRERFNISRALDDEDDDAEENDSRIIRTRC